MLWEYYGSWEGAMSDDGGTVGPVRTPAGGGSGWQENGAAHHNQIRK
jgi:hypothetical protein